MALEAAAQKYWGLSQHLRRGIQTEAERKMFLQLHVASAARSSHDRDERQLLDKLLRAS